MTPCTCDIVKFIFDISSFGIGHGLVASFAFGFQVSAFELEATFLVVEFAGYPFVETVAFGAICFSVDGKLTGMRIFVTTRAVAVHPGKFLHFYALRIFTVVTRRTGLPGMFSAEFKAGLGVVELHALPRFHRVAGLTILLRNVFFRHQPFVYIFVAIHTTLFHVSEAPLRPGLVAGKAGRGRVCAFQFEFGLIVSLNGVSRFGKSFLRMAAAAIGRDAILCKFAFVIISVAIAALFVFKRVSQVGFVARFAGHIFVFAFELVAGFVVVECTDGFDLVERFLAVALLAVLAEFIVVHIIVASHAVGKLSHFEALRFFAIHHFRFVALVARYGFVFAHQREFGVIVVKPNCRFEGIESVALRTVVRHLSPVVVGMATQTGLTQPHKGGRPVAQSHVFGGSRFVAGAAILLRMFAFQLETHRFVVKLFLIKFDELKIPPVVLVVAGGTLLRAHLKGGVISFVSGYLGLNLFVAIEAFGPCHLSPVQRVTFGAIVHALQCRMCFRQLSGGDLRR